MLINHWELPIECYAKKGILKEDHFLAKARLEFIIGNIEITLIGSSYGINKKVCIEKSKSEIIERFYSHKFIVTDNCFNARCLISSNPQQLKVFEKSQVTIGHNVDATGLSFNTKEKAETHAVSEIIERHWLARIWYKNEDLRLLENHKFQDYELMILTLSKYAIPFTIAVIVDKSRNLLFCGSAIRNNFKDSKKHSSNEAYMLYEGYLGQKHKNINTLITKSHNRIASLNKTTFNLQFEYLSSLIKSKDTETPIENEYDLIETIKKSGLETSDFFIIDFYRSENKSAIKAINENALSPKIMRAKQKAFLTDPFY